MKPEDSISNALRALAEHDRDRGAPEHVEIHLLRVFRQNRARRKRPAMVLASLAAAAAITLFFAMPPKDPQPAAPAPAIQETPVTIAAAPAPAPKVIPPKVIPMPRRRKQQPREVVTEFFPLLDVAPPFERGELLRVTVPASTMRSVGLPVNEDRVGERVYADVLVGQEGLARAIRFVSFEQ